MEHKLELGRRRDGCLERCFRFAGRQYFGIDGAGASPVFDSAPSLISSNNNELQIYFYGSQAHADPTITLSSALTQRFDIGSLKEGFTLAFADLAAPAASNASPTYSATASISGSGAAMTAQAILLIPASQSATPTPTGTTAATATRTATPTAIGTTTSTPVPTATAAPTADCHRNCDADRDRDAQFEYHFRWSGSVGRL